MASPRVTQQFIENIRGDTAVIPHGPRVTQQFIESIRSINTGPSVSAASLTEAGNAADSVSAGALLVATLSEIANAADAVLSGGGIFSASITESAGTGGATDAILFPGGSVFSVAVIEEQLAIDDTLGFPPVDVIGACDGGIDAIDVIGGCAGDEDGDAYGDDLYGVGFYGGGTVTSPVVIGACDGSVSRITIIGAET